MQRLLILCIKAYRLLISPFMTAHCRFYPSCSHYAVEAIEEYGALRGSGLTLKRLARCHPFHAGGYDPVPRHAKQSTSIPSSRPANND